MAAFNYEVANEADLSAEYGAFADFTTTTNVWTDVGQIGCTFYRTKHFVFVGATNTVNVQILGSIDGGATFPFTVESSFAVAAGATVTKTVTVPYTNLKVQADPAADNVHGTIKTNYLKSVY